jgi:large subunit ribosomal protein L15
MKLDNLPKRNSLKKRKRVGRGHGSGTGKTSGRGQTGQKSRSGGNIHPKFQGAGLSFFRRIPKLGGFTPINKIFYSPVNVSDLNDFEDGAEITIKELQEAGLVRRNKKHVKLLGEGELTKKLNIRVNAWSKSAEEKVTKAGGQLSKV